ncbi:UNVERIFIED_CONTAM: Astacin [Trichonephila clavipes]
MGAEIPDVLQPGALQQFGKTQGPVVKVLPVSGQRPMRQLALRVRVVCWSVIGRNGGMQNLSLGNGCAWVGLVIHELGHAIGLYHEHQRSDRDNYITVYRNNVIPDQMHNFVLTDPDKEIIYAPYEYASIMHYGNYAFSRQPNRLPTMVAKTGVRLYEPYEKPGFTQTDLYRIKQLYKC